MSGFYIHIPICRKVCYYCDFHFVASLKYKDILIEALLEEIKQKSENWKDTQFSTIYFGGGTPSVLSIEEINRITKQIYTYYKIDCNPEFTLEANPDDLSIEYLTNLKKHTTINRLSIGVQSFHDKDLTYINRRHDGNQAKQSILNAKEVGFTNLTIDLIYGIPGLTLSEWEQNINSFIELDIPHLASYHLSIEPKTVFGVFQKKNKIKPIQEDLSVAQYEMLTKHLKDAGYEHYEISNFAKAGKISEHNMGYWQGQKYIGIGPSSHSFNGIQRSWNVSNNTKYCDALLKSHETYSELEDLSEKDRFNDYLITSLRTNRGADLAYIKKMFSSVFIDYCTDILPKYIDQDILFQEDTRFIFTEKAWFTSDTTLSNMLFT